MLLQGNGQRAIETFSATDLRNCPVARLQPWLGISVTEFKRKVAEYQASNRPVVPGADATDTSTPADTPAAAAVATDDEQSGQQQESAALVTCSPDSTLGEAIEAAAQAVRSTKRGIDRAREDVRLAVRKVATQWTGKKPIVDVLLIEA